MPDGELVVEYPDDRPFPRRRRRHLAGPPAPLDPLPAEWRRLLARWVKRGGASRWETLARDAGTADLLLGQSLLDWLLRHGWAAVEEERRHGEWWPLRVELRGLAALHAALGLPDREDEARRWEETRAELERVADPVLAGALAALDRLPPVRALARTGLVSALLRWREQRRSGTRRDFAYFVRGDTKEITSAEWSWLEDNVDLGEFGIERHTPIFLMAAPLALVSAAGRLDLVACPDFAAITPATLETAIGAEGNITCWRLVENRTSFERAAREHGTDDGVVWLPGFAPSWWKKAVARLLELRPAPALIACDPDPAGIEIALDAAALWQAGGLSWQPWNMDPASLATLLHRKPLTERDRQRLAALRQITLPELLAALAAWMEEHGEKGEQEGLL